MSFNILVTCAGGGLVPQAIEFLNSHSRHKDIFVVAVDSSEDALGRYFADAFEVIPRPDASDYAFKLAEIVKKYSIDLLLPWSDDEALVAAENRELFENEGCQLACTELETLRVLSDKCRTYQFLDKAGLPVPKWKCVNSITELNDVVDDFVLIGLDFVVKPSVSRGGRDVSVILLEDEITDSLGGREVHMDIDEFKSKYMNEYSNSFPVVVMERLYEPTFDLDILALDGKLLRAVARRRLNPEVPNDGHIIEHRKDIYSLAPKIAEAFNLSWLYDCDIMLDKNMKPKIIEINPRPSGSAAVSIAAGINLLDDLISLALGLPLPECAIPYNQVIKPYTALKNIGLL